MPRMPRWRPPKDVAKALADGGGFWEDERWSPILVTAMSGTEHREHAIPVAWQIEFDPSADECDTANARLEEAGIEPDGYGWGEYIQRTIQASNPELAERLHLTDCETDTCVIWVEFEGDCRVLLEATWKLIFAA
jgi:hypothetical protein